MSYKEKTNKNDEELENSMPCCSLPVIQERDLSHISDGNRASLIALMSKMWVNGTNLTYFFFKEPARWRGGNDQEQIVRNAFAEWKDLGIGLTFREVDDPNEAAIRIGFERGGSWSYVGRDCLDAAPDPTERTTNYGWDLTTPYGYDTALHELGHVLGFPHEHQNPRAGIVWDEDRVYAQFSRPPNRWSRDKIYWNIIRKISASSVDGSGWDKDSIMHYQFSAGLIKRPSIYQTEPLIPAAGLSSVDVETARKIYPPILARLPELRLFESQRFLIAAGEQVDFVIKPKVSRKYVIQTFGNMDTVMVLFEVNGGVEEYLSADDDSGQKFNAKIEIRLIRNREYLVRTRLYFSRSKGGGALMIF